MIRGGRSVRFARCEADRGARPLDRPDRCDGCRAGGLRKRSRLLDRRRAAGHDDRDGAGRRERRPRRDGRPAVDVRIPCPGGETRCCGGEAGREGPRQEGGAQGRCRERGGHTRVVRQPRGPRGGAGRGRAVDTSHPTRVVGRGSPAGCTSAAVVAAVARGGIIRFSCGRKPVTIVLKQTAKVVNARPRIVLDGGGLVTLSGGGARRILYMNTCDGKQGWTTAPLPGPGDAAARPAEHHLRDGNSTGDATEGGGGGGSSSAAAG